MIRTSGVDLALMPVWHPYDPDCVRVLLPPVVDDSVPTRKQYELWAGPVVRSER